MWFYLFFSHLTHYLNLLKPTHSFIMHCESVISFTIFFKHGPSSRKLIVFFLFFQRFTRKQYYSYFWIGFSKLAKAKNFVSIFFYNIITRLLMNRYVISLCFGIELEKKEISSIPKILNLVWSVASGHSQKCS